MFNKTGSVHIM